MYFARAKHSVLRSDAYFTAGEPGQSTDDDGYRHELIFQFTPVHELFHAVQNTRLRMDQYASQDERRAVDWIIEGTATSVQVEYARVFDPESGAERRSRSFATPPHRPAVDETRGTWLFWSQVGEQVGSSGNIAWFRVDEEVKVKLEDIDGGDSQAMQETRAFEQEVLHSGTDNFGLTLQAIPGGANRGGLGGLAAMPGMAGFNPGVSGEYRATEGPGPAGEIEFERSMVYATVGVTDGDDEGVKFLWEPGKPGYASVKLERPTQAPLVHGDIEAELHAEHVYDGGRPKIRVYAGFVAREGFKSCIK